MTRCAIALTLTLTATGCFPFLPRTTDPHPKSTEECTALDGSRWNSRQGCVTWNRIPLKRLEDGTAR